MEWHAELLKITTSAFAGFFLGRFQTSFNDRVARNKDAQSELLKALRACTTSAIDYHTFSINADQLGTKSFHLKNQLWRIRTDIGLMEKSCNVTKGALLQTYLDYFDAVTAYPFEPTELSNQQDHPRLVRISTTGERLAAEISVARPSMF